MKKKNKILGTQSYVNQTTGEIINMQIVETDEYEKDCNFHKLFLRDFVSTLELVANQKTKICYWIISNLTKDNLLLYTYRQIADKTGISYKTVADTMQILQDADFLRKHSSGYYMVNPCIIFKGSYPRRCHAWAVYQEEKHGDMVTSEEMRLRHIQKTISKLQRQEKKLQENIDDFKDIQETPFPTD